MENYGKLWKTMENYGKLWKPMEKLWKNYGKTMENWCPFPIEMRRNPAGDGAILSIFEDHPSIFHTEFSH